MDDFRHQIYTTPPIPALYHVSNYRAYCRCGWQGDWAGYWTRAHAVQVAQEHQERELAYESVRPLQASDDEGA